MPMIVRAPAKLNLHLRVFPKAADGFHPLRSWFRTIGLFDDLTFELVEAGQDGAGRGCAGGRLDLRCDAGDVPRDETNLVCRAWAALPDAPPARVTLVKRIPAGGGLGGGSSDAAATFLAAEHFTRFAQPWRSAAKRFEENMTRAEILGSDVPFFVSAASLVLEDAICEGRGERVTPFAAGLRHAALLLLTGIDCPTPMVYRRFDALAAPADDGSPDFEAWARLPAAELLPLLRNDLEAATFSLRPILAAVRVEAETRLGRPVRMTGSGGTLFTLFDDAAAAGSAAESLRGWPAVRPVVA